MRAMFSESFFGSTMLGGAEAICEHGMGCKKCQKGKKRPIYDPFKVARRQGRMAGPELAQFQLNPVVNVNPNVKVDAPLNIELGGLPLSLGLFAGSGLTFLMKGELPEGWPQTTALVIGAALAAGGILNLVAPKAHAAAGAPGAATPAAPAGSGPGSSPTGAVGTQEIQPSQEAAFEMVVGEIVQPGDYSTVKVMPWSSSYPVRIQLHNPSSQPVNLTLLFIGSENGGLALSKAEATTTVQVTVNPGEVKNVDLDMPIVSGHVLDSVEVSLALYKQRVATEGPQMLNIRSFIVK